MTCASREGPQNLEAQKLQVPSSTIKPHPLRVFNLTQKLRLQNAQIREISGIYTPRNDQQKNSI